MRMFVFGEIHIHIHVHATSLVCCVVVFVFGFTALSEDIKVQEVLLRERLWGGALLFAL